MSQAPEDRLVAERPLPAPEFRGGLRGRVLALRPLSHRPPHLWAMAGACGAVGAVLLVLAALLAR